MVEAWSNDAIPQSVLQWNRMMWMREYRARLKANEVIYIKKNSIIKKN